VGDEEVVTRVDKNEEEISVGQDVILSYKAVSHMSIAPTYHRRHLPHYYLQNAVYFVTFCLAGSLPRTRVLELTEDRRHAGLVRTGEFDPFSDKETRSKGYVRDLEWIDKVLHGASDSVRWLSDARVAGVVSQAIKIRDAKEYELVAYTILPNHVHVVFGIGDHGLFEHEGQIDNLSYKAPSKIIGSLKRYTAKESNRILGRSGAFWQDESYDRVVRDGKELEAIVRYVLNNPVKAGFVNDWHHWKWTYSRFEC
jgi:putative transposase